MYLFKNGKNDLYGDSRLKEDRAYIRYILVYLMSETISNIAIVLWNYLL